jgi:hypothetical protein
VGGSHVLRGLHQREVVQRVDDLLALAVVLAALAHPEEPWGLELGLEPRLRVARQRVPPEVGPADAAHHRGRPREADVDHLGGEPDHLEDLGPPVRVDGGDAHLREDLQHPLLDGGLEALLRLGRRGVAAVVGVGLRRHRLEREAGADGVGPVAQ